MDTAVGLYSAAGAVGAACGGGLAGRLPRAKPEPRLLLNALGTGVGVEGALGALAGPAAEVSAPDDS